MKNSRLLITFLVFLLTFLSVTDYYVRKVYEELLSNLERAENTLLMETFWQNQQYWKNKLQELDIFKNALLDSFREPSSQKPFPLDAFLPFYPQLISSGYVFFENWNSPQIIQNLHQQQIFSQEYSLYNMWVKEVPSGKTHSWAIQGPYLNEHGSLSLTLTDREKLDQKTSFLYWTTFQQNSWNKIISDENLKILPIESFLLKGAQRFYLNQHSAQKHFIQEDLYQILKQGKEQKTVHVKEPSKGNLSFFKSSPLEEDQTTSWRSVALLRREEHFPSWSWQENLINRIHFFVYSMIVLSILTSSLYYLYELREQSLQSELQKQAQLDELTRSHNRAGLELFFKRVMNDFNEHGESFLIALLDLDYFKKINDTYGHDVGDQALIELSELVRSFIPQDRGILARLGGEEFLLIHKGFDNIQRAKDYCQTLRESIENAQFKRMVRLTASFGAFFIDKTSYKKKIYDYNELIGKLDHALYQSKERGRNCVTFVNPSFFEKGEG